MKLTTRSKNCHVVTFDNGTEVLFSCRMPVALSIGSPSPWTPSNKVGVYKTSEKFSSTTTKHINDWTATEKTLKQSELEQLINFSII